MSWLDLPATQATDWSRVDFIQQFYNAIEERRKVLGQSPNPNNVVSAGDDVQQYTFWTDIQSQVTLLVFTGPMGFVNVVNYPTGFQAVAANLWRYTGSTWLAAAGLNPEGFTRKYPRTISSTAAPGSSGQRAYWGTQDSEMTKNSDGSTRRLYEHDGSTWLVSEDQITPPDSLTSYGNMQIGDYIGPWIFNEIQAGLKVLTATMLALNRDSIGQPPGYTANATERFWKGRDTPGHFASTWDEATSQAEADWHQWQQGETPAPFGDPGFFGPYAWTDGDVNFFGSGWSAFAENGLFSYDILVTTDQVAASGEVYFLLKQGLGWSGGFDASAIGFGVGFKDDYVLLSMLPQESSLIRSTVEVGGTDIQSWPSPSTVQNTPNARRGFLCIDPRVVLYWNLEYA